MIKVKNEISKSLKNQRKNLKFLFEENNIAYSAKKNIAYSGENTDVCIYYSVDTPLQTGTYTIGIFADGNLIGTTGFVLQ